MRARRSAAGPACRPRRRAGRRGRSRSPPLAWIRSVTADHVGHELDAELNHGARKSAVQQQRARRFRLASMPSRAPQASSGSVSPMIARPVDGIEDRDEHGRDGQPEQVEQDQHTPSEVRSSETGNSRRDDSVGRATSTASTADMSRNSTRSAGAARDAAHSLYERARFRGKYRRPPRCRKPHVMNLHEYQSKALFAEYGIPVPQGQVASYARRSQGRGRRSSAASLWVVKAQVHAGGRGKAGGVKLARSVEEVEAHAKALLGTRLVTHQSGRRGFARRLGLRRNGLGRSRASCI